MDLKPERGRAAVRLVTVCITYDMYDLDKPLSAERQDWLHGKVDLFGVIASGDWTVTIREHRREKK